MRVGVSVLGWNENEDVCGGRGEGSEEGEAEGGGRANGGERCRCKHRVGRVGQGGGVEKRKEK